jgi:hypothetical protein
MAIPVANDLKQQRVQHPFHIISPSFISAINSGSSIKIIHHHRFEQILIDGCCAKSSKYEIISLIVDLASKRHEEGNCGA